MNMYYTGLGIARSLGEHGVPVIGLTAQRGVYGNYTRFAQTVFCPDSRTEPEALLRFLLGLGERQRGRSVLFPTRDHDLVFLDRFRQELAPYFLAVIPERPALAACLNKWQTHQWAQQVGIPAPKCRVVQSREEAESALEDVGYPCVLKPLEAHHWRKGQNWEFVGGRKAIAVFSKQEFLAEYAAIARAESRILVQELIPGGDECLRIAACYMDRHGEFSGGFNTRKLVQIPEGFGTGCIVEADHNPELLERTVRLLKAMRYTGIAEVEYKWDAAAEEFKLIEINPRPWDQHRLGNRCGVDLAYLAYCDCAGLPKPATTARASSEKWIAEDAFLMAVLRLIWRRDPQLRSLLRLARGKRVYAIWSARDPLPFLAYLARSIPSFFHLGWTALRRMLRRGAPDEGLRYEGAMGKGASHG